MKIALDVEVEDIAAGLGQAMRGALTKAATDAIQYGSLGRVLKDAADKTVVVLAQSILTEEAFRAEMRGALQAGILAGIRTRGEKIAKGMALQQAMDLAQIRAKP